MAQNNILRERMNQASGQIINRDYTKSNFDTTQKASTLSNEDRVIKQIKSEINKIYREKILEAGKDQEFINQLQETINQLLSKETAVIDSLTKRQLICRKIMDDILGFGPLQELLENKEITEIMVSRYDKIYIEQKGKMVLADITFIDEEQLRNVIDKIVQPIGRKIDESDPLVDARLPDGSRVNATIQPISPDGATLTIRKFSEQKLVVQDYLNFGSLDERMATFLEGSVKARCNVLVSGGTGSGKTTLLNMLSNFVPATDSIVTVEDSCELKLYQDNVRRLEARPANSEGKGAVTIRDLVKNCLRMRPDRIIVGEIRDGAVVDMFRAMSSGHDGSLTTIHSNSPRDLVDSTIGILFGMSDMKFSEKAIQQLICSAVDLIVQISRMSDGTRKITNITHVVGYGKQGASKLKLKEYEPDKVYLQDIFKFHQTGVNPETKKIEGRYIATGYVPMAILDKAMANRWEIPKDIFVKDNIQENL